MNNKIKKIYISAAQKAALIEFMDVYPQLLAGKYTNTFTQHDAKRLWEQIALDLNSMPGSSKTWNQWRKTWKDIKSKTKPKQAAVFRHGQIRSGGPPIKNNMHQGNERVPELIHPIAIQEDIRVPESSINVDGHFTLKTELEIVDHDYGEYDGITYNADQKNFQEIPKEEKKEHTTLANNKTQTKLNVATTTTLAEQNDEFNLKKKYYEDKLQLLRENTMVKKKEVLAKQRIADALEKIAKCLNKK